MPAATNPKKVPPIIAVSLPGGMIERLWRSLRSGRTVMYGVAINPVNAPSNPNYNHVQFWLNLEEICKNITQHTSADGQNYGADDAKYELNA